MEYSAKQLQHAKLTDDELTDLSLEILNHYKDGKYAFEPEASAQSPCHHNHKRYCKDALKEFLNKDDKIPIRKYIVPLTEYIKETNAKKVIQLKFVNRQLQKKVDEYNLREVGQNKSHCGVCHYVIKDAVQKEIAKYEEENSDNAHLKTITHLRERVKLYEKKVIEYEQFKEQMRYTTSVPTDEYNKMILKISTLESHKGDPSVKKLKKQIKKQAKLIATLQNAESSSEDSSAGEDDF